MTREETKNIVMTLSHVYPNFKESTPLIDSWAIVLEDCDYKSVMSATYSYIRTDTKGFAPTPGQIIDQISKIQTFNEPSEMEAWNLVSKALRDSTYHSEERFNELPALVKKAVGSPSVLRDWGQTDIESVGTVIQSNFLKTYRAVRDRQKEFSKLPVDVQQLIQSTTQRLERKDEKIISTDS